MLTKLAAHEILDGWARGKGLEYLILRAFELEGAEVTWPFSVRFEGYELEQLDGTINDDGLICLVEAKHEKKKIAYGPIAKLRSQLSRRPGQALGAIFSVSGFTREATILAQFHPPTNIVFWELDDIRHGLSTSGMRAGLKAKFQYAVKYGLIDYNLLSESVQ